MAKDISLLGAQYPDVPGVTLPQTGGGTATFWDIDDTTATASDVLAGIYFYDDDGVKTEGSIETNTSSDLTVSGDTVTVPAGYYADEVSAAVDSGEYAASVDSHSVTTTPVVTGALSGSGTGIGTTTQPSGTDGTDYWTFTPGGSVTTTGKSTASGKATVSTAGYIDTGSDTSGNSVVDITPTVSSGTARYIKKGAITNNTSGGTSSGTINRGKQIKIGAGYYASDSYYQAQSNSGTLTITQSGTTSCNGYANVDVPKGAIVISVSSSSNTSTTINNSNITANHYVYNTSFSGAAADISWSTAAGSITISCSDGIPAMTLMLCLNM